MIRRDQFKSENQCRADGCNGEVFAKVSQGGDAGLDRRQAGSRSPLSPVSGGYPPNQQMRTFPEGSRILSSFCKKHTCSLFLADDGCGFKKPIHDTVCALHTKCPIPGCTRAKSQYLDPSNDPAAVPKYLRHEFCPDHKCLVSKCPRRRALHQTTGQASNGQQGRFLTVCQQHHCKADGCLEQSLEGRNCCPEHECKTPGCRTIVEGSYPFCAIHIKCTVANCGKARHLPRGAKEYLSGCEIHATCAAGRCSELRILGSIFCVDHTCQDRACDKPVTEGMYCNSHRCEYESCRSPKSWQEKRARGKYCSQHTCRNEECRESVGTLALFCMKHQCSQERCLAKVLDEKLCIDHFKALYIAKGRAEDTLVGEGIRRRPTFPVKSLDYRHTPNGDWHQASSLITPIERTARKSQIDRRATVSPHIDSDYDEDAKQSVMTGGRLSHTDEEVDHW